MRRRNVREGGWDGIAFYYDMTTWMDGYLKDFTGSIRPYIGGGRWAVGVFEGPLAPPKLQEARNAASAQFRYMQAALAEEYGVSLTKARNESPDLIDFLNDVSDAVKQASGANRAGQ